MNEPAEVLLAPTSFGIQHLEELRLALELEITRELFLGQLPGAERRAHSTARFVAVCTVAEAAPRGELGDLAIARIDAFLRREHSELAHPRVVDDERTTVEQEELPANGRMPAFTGATDPLRGEPLPGQKAIDESALADARRPDDPTKQ